MSDRNLGSDAEIQVGGVDDRARVERIKRLHTPEEVPFNEGVFDCGFCRQPWPCDATAAADALEKSWDTAESLRSENERLAAWVDGGAEDHYVETEARLQARLDRQAETIDARIRDWHRMRDERDAALAEVARLRDALERIASAEAVGRIPFALNKSNPADAELIARMDIAAAALGGGSLAATPKEDTQ